MQLSHTYIKERDHLNENYLEELFRFGKGRCLFLGFYLVKDILGNT